MIFFTIISICYTFSQAHYTWQIPPIEVNIKPLGTEVGHNVSQTNLWMSYVILAQSDENFDKLADISFVTEFTET